MVAEIVSRIKDAARNLGFSVIGITSAEPLAKDLTALIEWRKAGYAAGMEYMTGRGALPGTPGALVPSAASVISLGVNYYSRSPEFHHENRFGRIARYAWGRDYHDVIRPRLYRLSAEIEALTNAPPSDSITDDLVTGGHVTDGRAGNNAEDRRGRIPNSAFKSRSFVDAVPLLERAVARRAGLGFFGKNTNILQPRAGSWFFLAEIFVNVDLPPLGEPTKVSCGSCTRCVTACPTAAFPSPYVLDSNLCISYLTIENKGPIPPYLREGIGDWIFGCDICQDVCPFNRFSSETDWPELMPEAGPGPRLDLVEILGIQTENDFRSRFAGTALLRPKRRGLLRNAAVVAANIFCTAAVPELVERAERDPEPLIRSHALYGLSKLDRASAKSIAERARCNDPDGGVRQEAEKVLAGV